MSIDYIEKIIEMIDDAVPGIIIRTDSGDGYWDYNSEVCFSVEEITYTMDRVYYDVSLICSELCYNSYLNGTFLSPGGYYVHDKDGSFLVCEDLTYRPWDKSWKIKFNTPFVITSEEEYYYIEIEEDERIWSRLEILDIRWDK